MSKLRMTWYQTLFNLRIYYKTLLIWTIVLVGFILISIQNIKQTYPDQKSLDDIYNVMQMPLMAMLFGYFNYSLPNNQASQFVAETTMVAFILMAVMNILLAIKMTRQKEDEGITDLVLTTKAARLSPNASAYLIIFFVNMIICSLSFLSLQILNLDSATPKGHLFFTLGLFIVGFLFQNIAFFISELASNAANAKSLSFFIFGVLFIFRMFVDYRFINLQIISPLSWGGSINPYGGNNFSAIIIGFIISIILLGGSLWVNQKRDIGSGIISEFKGKGYGSKLVNNPYSFRLKLNKWSLIIWMILVMILGLLFGSLVDSVHHFADNPIFLEILQGSEDSIISMMKSLVNLISIMAVNLSMYFGLKIFYQIKKEQYANLLDLHYHSKITRRSIYLSHVIIGMATSMLIFFVNMLFMYLGQNLLGNNYLQIDVFMQAFFNYLPLIFFVFSISILLYVIKPKYAYGSYLLIAIIFSINTFGIMFLNVPSFVNKLLVIGFLANAPITPIDFLPWSIIIIKSIAFIIVLGFLYNKKSLNNLLT